MAVCKKSTTTPGTSRDTSKSSLLENLKKRLDRKRHGEDIDTSTSKRHLVGNKHAKKELKRVELGWMHFGANLNSYKQVRGVSGGGTRHIKIDANLSIRDILEVGKEFFFPGGLSKKGSAENFSFCLWSYNKSSFKDDSLTIRELYKTTKLKMIRLYVCSKPIDNKDHDKDKEVKHTQDKDQAKRKSAPDEGQGQEKPNEDQGHEKDKDNDQDTNVKHSPIKDHVKGETASDEGQRQEIPDEDQDHGKDEDKDQDPNVKHTPDKNQDEENLHQMKASARENQKKARTMGKSQLMKRKCKLQCHPYPQI